MKSRDTADFRIRQSTLMCESRIPTCLLLMTDCIISAVLITCCFFIYSGRQCAVPVCARMTPRGWRSYQPQASNYLPVVHIRATVCEIHRDAKFEKKFSCCMQLRQLGA